MTRCAAMNRRGKDPDQQECTHTRNDESQHRRQWWPMARQNTFVSRLPRRVTIWFEKTVSQNASSIGDTGQERQAYKQDLCDCSGEPKQKEQAESHRWAEAERASRRPTARARGQVGSSQRSRQETDWPVRAGQAGQVEKAQATNIIIRRGPGWTSRWGRPIRTITGGGALRWSRLSQLHRCRNNNVAICFTVALHVAIFH